MKEDWKEKHGERKEETMNQNKGTKRGYKRKRCRKEGKGYRVLEWSQERACKSTWGLTESAVSPKE